jgi:glyoxylase-like metal-dependent hydrolase (beta-lactamase superfamily II)
MKVKEMLEPYRVGDIEVITVADGQRTFPLPEDFIVNADRAAVNGALAQAGMPADQMTIVFNPVIARTAGETVLIDTGNGPGAPAGAGLLMASLAKASIAPEAIGLIIISHFHGDHINGLLAADGKLAFPNAVITVPAPEWAFWTDETERDRAAPGRMQELFQNVARVLLPHSGRIRQHQWGREVVPGLTAVATPGHSLGHTSYMLRSGRDRLFIQCDLTNHPALFVRHPGWHARFDQDPVMAEAARRRVYEMLASERIPVQGFHFPSPCRALIERDGEGYRLIALHDG